MKQRKKKQRKKKQRKKKQIHWTFGKAKKNEK